MSNKTVYQFVVTPKIRELIRAKMMPDASDVDLDYMLSVAEQRNLNPMLNQIYFVQRWDKDRGGKVWSAQVSIDGLRILADRTGLYNGYSRPTFKYTNGGTQLVSAEVLVWRKDWKEPAYGFAYWDEYVQEKSHFWQKKPHVMLEKVAFSVALRHAFPDAMSGMYTPEEMGNELDVPDENHTTIAMGSGSNQETTDSVTMVDADDESPPEAQDTPEMLVAMEDLRAVSGSDIPGVARVWNKHESAIFTSTRGDIDKINNSLLEFLAHFDRTISTNRFRRYTEAEKLTLTDSKFATIYQHTFICQNFRELAELKIEAANDIVALDLRARKVLEGIFADKVNQFDPEESRPNVRLKKEMEIIVNARNDASSTPSQS